MLDRGAEHDGLHRPAEMLARLGDPFLDHVPDDLDPRRSGALVAELADLLRLDGAPVEAALTCGLLLGLLALPASLLVSRKAGYAAYCRGLCPLGLLAKWLGRLAPWRVRRTGSCRRCMACVRVCRQDAMSDPATTTAPNADCNL